MIGQKIFMSFLIIFVFFFALAVFISISGQEAPKYFNKVMTISFFGMILGKIVKVWSE